MEQAYDLKVLVDKLKARGLELTEETAKGAIVDVCDWLEQSAKVSKTPWDDVALVVLPQAKVMALGAAEKINPAD